MIYDLVDLRSMFDMFYVLCLCFMFYVLCFYAAMFLCLMVFGLYLNSWCFERLLYMGEGMCLVFGYNFV
jgi:hypothetical protein